MDNQFNVKDLFILMVLTTVVLLLLGCGGSDEGGSTSSSNPPSSGSTRPALGQGEEPVQLERLTLTAYPIKTKGTSELTLLTGSEQSFLAVGEYSNGQSKVLTEELTVGDWQSSDTELGEFIQSGVLKGKASGVVTVAFSQGNLTSNSLEVTVTDATITDITITPSAVNLAKGHHQPLTATATYSNGLSMNISDSVTWVSDAPSKATITSQTDHGLLNGVSVGSTTVTAIKEGITSQLVDVEVSDAVITAINITPAVVGIAKGQHQTLTATAIYSDGTSSIISDSVVWRLDTKTATITSNGVLSGEDIGTTTLTATKDGITSLPVGVVVSEAELVSISVTPPMVTVAKGQRQALTATAIYSDNTSSDISNYVTWNTIEPSTATVAPGGKVTGVNVGTTSLTAVKNGITSNRVSVDVSNAVVTGISVTPSVISIAKGQTQTLTANAIYSDNTSSDISDSVTWIPSDTSIAVVTENGVLSGSNAGDTSLTALKDGVTSHSVSVEVSDAVLTSIDVTPSLVNVARGQNQTLTATATYSDNTFSDVSESVTWIPIDTSIAAVTAKGVLSGSNIGTTTLTAVKDNVTSHSVSVEVNDAVLTAINVTPTELTVAKGHSQPLIATATYSDNTSSDISDSVTWIPVDTTTATVTPQGQVTGVGAGTTTVTAAKDNITSNTINVDITNAVMTGLTINPSSVGIVENQMQPLTATATYSDGTSAVVHAVTWWTPVNNVMSVTYAGYVRGLSEGNSRIKAAYKGFTKNVEVNVCGGDGSNVTGKCIYTLDAGDSKLFTSTPSIAYLDSLNLRLTSSTNGMFYTFTRGNADLLCNKYNELNIAGRSNWRIPTLDEISTIYYRTSLPRNWSNNTHYWTSRSSSGGRWWALRYEKASNTLFKQRFGGSSYSFYASCVSEP